MIRNKLEALVPQRRPFGQVTCCSPQHSVMPPSPGCQDSPACSWLKTKRLFSGGAQRSILLFCWVMNNGALIGMMEMSGFGVSYVPEDR